MSPSVRLKIQGFALNTHARTLMILLLPLNIPRARLSADFSPHAAKDSGLCAEHPRAQHCADASADGATDAGARAERATANADDTPHNQYTSASRSARRS